MRTGYVSLRATGLTSVLGAVMCTAGAQPPPPEGAPPPANKRALIVAIARYDPTTGWGPIASDNDVPLVRDALVRHGFPGDAIHVLADAQATRQGILDAVKQDLLTAARGDVVVFHYSGHGQQLPDDGDEEIDGYDEAIVPYDAPSQPRPGYKGEKHLRDDDLAEVMQALRQRVGPAGNVVAVFDSCFSGAISRGEASVRGGPALGPPRAGWGARGGASEAGGFFELGSRGAAAAAPSGLAPFVVLSASRYDELTWETRTPDGQKVGPLSYAMSAVLTRYEAGGHATYRRLHEEIERTMHEARVPNQPQIEGDVDSEVFSGRAVRQAPFIAVAAASADGRQVTLAGGTLLGLERGTEVELRTAGATGRADGGRLAEGRVVGASPVEATVELGAAAAPGALRESRAFVTKYSFGEVRIRASLEGVGDVGVRRGIETALRDVAAVEVVDASPDVRVEQDGHGGVLVRVADTGLTLLGPVPRGDLEVGDQVANRLQDYARSRYLGRLRLDDEGLAAGLEFVPVKLSECSNPARPDERTCRVDRLEIAGFQTTGHGLAFPIGTYFKLRVMPASRKAYLAVLDLVPDGTIAVLWPPRGRKEQTEPGEPKELPGLWQLSDPPGLEVFKLVASDDWVDFTSFGTVPSLRSRGPVAAGSLGAFAPLFEDAAIRTRARPVIPQGAASTFELPFRVEPKAP